MFTKTLILGPEPLTRTVGPTRRNRRLELFSDSDREVLAGEAFPRLPCALGRRIEFG
jgi:hypothetical protein